MQKDMIYKSACEYISANDYTHKRLKRTTEMTPEYLKSIGIKLEEDEQAILGLIHPTIGNNNRQFFLLTDKYLRYQNLQQMPPWYCKGFVSFLIGPLVSLLMLRNMQTAKIPFNPSETLNISEKGNRAYSAYCGNVLSLNDKFLGLLMVGRISSDKNLVNYINNLLNHLKNQSKNNGL